LIINGKYYKELKSAATLIAYEDAIPPSKNAHKTYSKVQKVTFRPRPSRPGDHQGIRHVESILEAPAGQNETG
jgi:hypothetical protein